MVQDTLRSDRPGIALAVVLLVMIAVGAMATAAAMVGSNAVAIHAYDDRQSLLEAAADAGLEEARALINGNRDLYPTEGFAVLENQAAVFDANGNQIPGVRRTTYVGPTGATTGQYGVFGSIVTVAEAPNGDRVIRRAEVTQESFAKYAYFTNIEGDIVFGGGDQLFGPVHSNDRIEIHSTGATFHGRVTTASTITGRNNGTFREGYQERVARIPMPQTADLSRLRTLAAPANMAFTTSTTGSPSQAAWRIEFVAVDLNGDGDVTDADEGFIKIYRARQDNDDGRRWVTAVEPSDYGSRGLRNSRNCGEYRNGVFTPVSSYQGNNNGWISMLTSRGRCFLGGDSIMWGEFRAQDPWGEWIRWPGIVHPRVAATGRADSAYLWPISRALNPEFKGVIHVQGKIAISGVVRGHVTLAATGDIVIVDDLVYATNPGGDNRNCFDDDEANDDILGLFAGGNVVIADNTLNSPYRPNPRGSGNANNYFTFDDTSEEIVHAVILTLNSFTADNFRNPPTNAERCGTTNWGRGCLYLTGGVIQGTRGAVGQSSGTGYLKRYSYDSCAAASPPPYFPTTGWFTRGHYFEVDPIGFDIDEYFDRLTTG